MSFLICLLIAGFLCVLLEFFLPSGIVGLVGGGVLAFTIVWCYTSGEIGPEPWKRHAWAASILLATGMWIWLLFRTFVAGGGRAGMTLREESSGVSQLADAVEATVEACKEAGVEFLTLYAFSSENWQRPKLEVAALMRLLENFLRDKTAYMLEKNVRLHAIGQLHRLPKAARAQLDETMARTAHNTAITMILALSYGARDEILDATRALGRSIAAGTLQPQDIHEHLFSQHLYTAAYPDPDLLIRTSGEQRLSNFLLWQLSYAEIYITPRLWPDFGREDLFAALEEYQRRQRRFGK